MKKETSEVETSLRAEINHSSNAPEKSTNKVKEIILGTEEDEIPEDFIIKL